MQARYFTVGGAQATGSTGELTPREARSLINAAYLPVLGWQNPALTTFEKQALVPMFNQDPIELGLQNEGAEMLDLLKNEPAYKPLFAAAFPGDSAPFTLDNVVRALASFERTIISGGSPYDRRTFGGDQRAKSESAKRGMLLFLSQQLRRRIVAMTRWPACAHATVVASPIPLDTPVMRTTRPRPPAAGFTRPL